MITWRLAVSLGAGLAMALVASSGAVASAFPSNSPNGERVPGGLTGSYVVPAGVHKIKHVVVIQQENRSFDNYFGTFPGADGIPMQDGRPTVCVPDPASGEC